MASYTAGWYPDYAQADQQRYWDGEQWTHYVIAPEPTGRRRRKLPTFKPSAQLVGATYRMLLADRSMVAFLFGATVLAALAGAAIAVPSMVWGHITPSFGGGGVVGVLVAGASLGVAGFVIQLATGAVVAAAMLRAEGRPVTVREALVVAWGRRRQLLAWALVSTVVGVVVRMLERLGIGGLLAALTLNVGWAFATVFATPVIMAEGTMPAATVRRSAEVLRRRFTVTLVTGAGLALPWAILAWTSIVLGIVGGFTVALAGSTGGLVIGLLLLVPGVLGFCFSLAVSSALSAYLQAFLYRYATGLPVPGVDQHLLPPLRP